MRKVLLLILIFCTLVLYGCQYTDSYSQSETDISNNITTQTYSDGDYTGLWTHIEYPDAYSLIIFDRQDNKISFEITAVRGNGAQIATAQVADVELIDGKGTFEFTDSFDNSGNGKIAIIGDTLSLEYNTNEPYQGNWCIDAGQGSYKKTKELSEVDWFNTKNSEIVNSDKELDYDLYGVGNSKEIEGKSYLWYGRYYLAGNDLEYDKEVYFDICADGTAEKTYYGRTAEGEYHMYESDKNEYDFRVLFKFDNGEEFMLYGKANNPKNDIKFYLYTVGSGTLSSYGRYLNETYIGTESMVRSTNK